MTEPVILKRVKPNNIVEITLNRPKVFNSYNEELLIEFSDAFDELEKDGSVRALVLRGAGKHFSAGADINWFKELSTLSEKEKKRAAELSTDVMQKLCQSRFPTIALVHNACFGGGIGWVASCDIVIATEDARFAITEVRVGIPPAPILPQIIEAIGVRQARRFTLTAEAFDVYKAQRIGLVHEICADGDLDKTVEPILESILKSAPNAVSLTKNLINEISQQKMAKNLYDKLATISAEGRNTAEGIEGFSAFLEKRNPVWYDPD